ncbi:hypothetical protein Y88_0806 [Novosphingobium nitrogenifigens DSM 19370]|uniref:ATPase n=1 Tax=Novosphingobium nitrogenifigens DSM 19370 TaxID=983920 RepID=F1Z9J4_9SPHN|nr:hypothetical protein [Novosphingobium nitrogenifigens]EGD58748.1 hypothetical protein Y88_0806 [Novosphingobium nitrogenifigens DSM 19370]
MLEPTDETGEDETYEVAPVPRFGRIIPIAAGLAILGWTILFAFGKRRFFAASFDAATLADLIAAWALPVVLVLVLLLLTRTSWREASRYARVSTALARDSRMLEERLSSMNRELAQAHALIETQSQDLDALGRTTVERLTTSAGELRALISDKQREVENIGTVLGKALDNFENINSNMPTATASARDLANAIATSGRTADVQLNDLIAGFNRLNDFGVASGRKVDEVKRQVETALTAFADASDRIGRLGEDRLREVTLSLDSLRNRLQSEEQAALAAMRTRAETLAGEITAQREVIVSAEEDGIAALSRRIATFEGEMRRVASALTVAIDEVGRDHDSLVSASRHRLTRFEEDVRALNRTLSEEAGHIDAAMGTRREALATTMASMAEAFRSQLETLDTAIGQRRAALAAAAADVAETLDARLAVVDASIEEQHERQIENIETLARTCDVLVTRINGLASVISSSSEEGSRTAAIVDAAVSTLNARLNGTREALNGTDRTVTSLTDGAVRLLELIEAAGEHTRTQLPEALRSASAGLGEVEGRVVALRDTLREAGDAGRTLAGDVGTTQDRLGVLFAEIVRTNETLLARADEQEQRLSGLRDALRATQTESDLVTGSIERRLAGAIAELETAAVRTGSDLSSKTASEISAMADRLGEETSTALARAIQGRGAQMIARLEEAIDNAASSARETAVQLRDQLAKIDELAGNLENRVSRAREKAEEKVDSDFARRTAIITESLNSTAIDITRILSQEVSESAWASYLRGERGIFTRRAVSLLENSEARLVQQHYENDADFRTHVNRYIHDFESMLRQLLSTRDGNALGVTLLSSDMGKLYVVLAQGIERLRA